MDEDRITDVFYLGYRIRIHRAGAWWVHPGRSEGIDLLDTVLAQGTFEPGQVSEAALLDQIRSIAIPAIGASVAVEDATGEAAILN